ncbi:hypothetical protein GBL_1311 [Geobacillus kaustophilus GBlys]|uniref:Uncharacterized protein n=1 Tax=Geobacillus kaustophilus GBlys TaxID=1337888 RepID=U2Y1Y1_GEOKU|nr:hypothetical protein GBL_1311 [Geobacillus kaustophilus GBlys]
MQPNGSGWHRCMLNPHSRFAADHPVSLGRSQPCGKQPNEQTIYF